MIRLPPRSTRTDTLCPYTTLFRASLFVSEAEAALFRDRSGLGADRVHAVGNGIDTGFFDPAQPLEAVGQGDGPLAVFTGQMDYRPNIDAVRSEERRVGKECGSTCRSRWSPYH